MPRPFMEMAKQKQRDPVVRYLLAQTGLGLAVGPLLAGVLVATDVNGLRTLLLSAHPADAAIFLASTAMAFVPLVVATAIGLLAWEPGE